MGLNAKEISLRVCKMLLAFYDKSSTFVQRHPVVSGFFSVSFILYIFLSYIYSFLVYLSPFILVTVIFIRIFWSSEQPQLRYVKREKRRSDFKHSRLAGKYCRSDFVLDRYYTYSSHYNTSRRRSSRDKKWGLHGGNNAVSEINTESKGASALERLRDSSSDNGDLPAKKSASPNRQTLRSEPSLSDLVHYGLMEGIREDENEGTKDDDRIKDVGCQNNGKKESMDLVLSELERKFRMESLIANRKARKELKMQLDKGVNPTHHLAPVLITRSSSFKGSRRFEVDRTEIPDSAPSIIRPARTFNFLYNSSQEKPSFHQESTEGNQKDKTISGHESFSLGRFRRFPDKGKESHDRLIEQMFSKSGIFDSDETSLKSPKPQSNCKEPDRNNGFAEIDQNISSFQRAGLSEKPGPTINQMTPEKLMKFPISKSTTINESLFKSLASPIEKNPENMFYAGRQIHRTQTQSIASDLQVEVSEVGSPTKTFNGSSLSSDEESSVYDGDNEKDNSSGSEDIWGNSVHVREVHGIGDFEGTPKANINSNKDVHSPFPLQEIDEENSADVSSVSSTCELPGDTPTCAVSYDQNLFGEIRETVTQNETAQHWNSLDVPSSQANSERLEEWCNLYENYTEEAEEVRDMNDSARVDKDHTHDKMSNRDCGISTLHQKSIADISVHSNLSFSPRSVLPKKNPTDEVSLHASDQQKHTQVPQSNEKEAIDLTKLAAGTSSANIPTEEKVPLNKEKEVECQTSMNQESAAKPCMGAKPVDSRPSNNFELKQDDLKENEAVVSSKSERESGKSSETEHSEEPRQVIQPENFIMSTMKHVELPPEDMPHNMQHYVSGYLTT
ncbi:uncharacterized protein LOC129300659 isoform X2 [Prosopis cineraria]|uniref:uncharacterized protein LOC129300659 isoform X2 n=1 Tax=Prosopis cineraria TaxID=364024 RepID=UPI0024100569|nr:uncharacterized protein LOC129300659 isoform X2 [Prosopis cineraria]